MITFDPSTALKFATRLEARRYTQDVNDDGFPTRTVANSIDFMGTVTKDTDADAQLQTEGIRTFKSIKILTLPLTKLETNDEVIFAEETYKITGFDKAHAQYGYVIYKANSLAVEVS